MTIRELSYLVALADKKNFGRAAEACHVGQPTLSVQLKKLDDYLEVTLFERDNHPVSPTPIGEEVIARARVALKALGEIRELSRQARDPMDGTVRLGVIPTLAPFLPSARSGCRPSSNGSSSSPPAIAPRSDRGRVMAAADPPIRGRGRARSWVPQSPPGPP